MSSSGERGIVLIVALLAIAVLFTLVTAVSSVALGEVRASPFWRDRTEAFYVAESGVNHALWKMTYDEVLAPIPEGEYGVTEPSFTSASTPESSALLPDGSLLLPPGSSYEVWIQTDPLVPALRRVTVLGRVGSQTCLITVSARQTQVPFPDEGGPVVDPPPLYFPPDTDDLTSITITVADLILPPGTYVVDSVRCDGSGDLVVTGDVTIWVRESILVTGTCIVNPNPASYSVVFFMPPASKQNVSIGGGATFNAFVYAPAARIRVAGTSSVYGSLVGEEVSGMDYVVYDPAGQEIPFPASAMVPWEMVAWGE